MFSTILFSSKGAYSITVLQLLILTARLGIIYYYIYNIYIIYIIKIYVSLFCSNRFCNTVIL